MQLRLECYEHEEQAAQSAISEVFNIKSVSKGYANVRQTAVSGVPCEYRYYIKLSEREPVRSGQSWLDVLATDMLRFLAWLSDTAGIDASGEIGSLRTLYNSAPSMTERQVLQLFLEWKMSLLMRHAGKIGTRKEASEHAAGNH